MVSEEEIRSWSMEEWRLDDPAGNYTSVLGPTGSIK